nr:hypothetical protein CFP56_32590 [Quercus suber]
MAMKGIIVAERLKQYRPLASSLTIVTISRINNAGILGTIVNVEERKKLSSDEASLTMLCRGLGVCKLSPEPTTPTGTDPPAAPLAPTDGADAGDRNDNGAPMPSPSLLPLARGLTGLSRASQQQQLPAANHVVSEERPTHGCLSGTFHAHALLSNINKVTTTSVEFPNTFGSTSAS